MSLETFASPSLRWSLLIQDFPGATRSFKMERGSSEVPEEYGGKGNFCVCTITFPSKYGVAPVTANKSVPAKGSADDWATLCTKTLGRALKAAGYPDDMGDLKALVLWRQRQAEIAAIAQNGEAFMLSPSPKPLELEAAPANPQEYDPVEVAAEAPEDGGSDEITDAEILSDDDQDDADSGYDIQAARDDIRAELNTLNDDETAAFRAWLKEMNMPPKVDQWTESQLDDVETWLKGEG